MKCPHCAIDFHDEWVGGPLYAGQDRPEGHAWSRTWCPACKKPIIKLLAGIENGAFIAWPKGSTRPVPPEVPADLAADFTEACLVLAVSPKASAALSRRCLQHLLREHAKVKHSDLAKEIQELLDRKELHSSIADALDAVRQVGNFAAHPMKSKASGEILDVEPHEAEWTLDVLESLFDVYFVAPAKLKAKRDALNAKLAEAGKPNLKTG